VWHVLRLRVKEPEGQEILHGVYRKFEEEIDGSLVGGSSCDEQSQTIGASVLRGLFESERRVTPRKIS